MIIIINNNKKPFTIIGKKKSGGGLPDGVLPEVAENEDILAIKNVDTVEGTILMRNPNNIPIQYSTNGSDFSEYTTASEVPIGVGGKVYFKWSGIIGKESNSTALVSSSVKYKVYGELKQGNSSNAYRYMFRNQSNLTDASELKLTATTLKDYCYSYMFRNCTSLTTAPALPATTLASYCYYYMFQGCSSLTTAPELPATTLKEDCYGYMFNRCTSLTTAPELPATELATSCYNYMFYGCTSLTQAPELPATQLADYCYGDMFSGCTSLTQAPELPATTLASNCYRYMFYNCTSLNYVKHNITEWNASYTQNWLSNVSATGTVECPADSTIPSNSTSGIPSGWTRVNTEYTDILFFTSTYFNTNGQVKISEDCIVDEFKYTSLPINMSGGLNYDELDYPTVSKGETIEINNLSGTYILWKGALRNNSSFDTPIFEIITDTEVRIAGRLNNGSFDYAYYYMLSGNTALSNIGTGLALTSEYVGRSAYQNMFFNCSNFDDGNYIHISAKVVGDYGLGAMFSGCSSLTTTPYLGNIEQIGSYGMASMFRGCTSLTSAPELPVTSLASSCYSAMFSGCTSLVEAPELPATELATWCYSQMFYNCTSLVEAPAILPATELLMGCYGDMFRGCSLLTTAPEISATTLTDYCCQYMFSGCSKLNYVKHHITEWNTSNTSGWLSWVASNGTMYCPLNSTIPSNDASGIPSGWTRVNIDENGNVIPDEPSLPEVAENEDILAIENVDTVEGTVFMNNPNNIAIQYSTDGTEFNEYTTATEIPIGVGEKVYFKWSDVLSKSSNSTALVSSSVKYKVYGELKQGNISYAYCNMFYKQTNLIDASELKLTSTSLTHNCYRYMFYYCTSLTTAPAILPATTLEQESYYRMFQGCTSLIQAPEISATKLAYKSCQYMFSGCSSLNYVKHHITEWSTSNTSDWLNNVSATGTVECPANSTIPSNNNSGIPTGWTRVDIE